MNWDLWEHGFSRGRNNPGKPCPYPDKEENRELRCGWLNGQEYHRQSIEDAEQLSDLLSRGYTKQEAGQIILFQMCAEVIESGS